MKIDSQFRIFTIALAITATLLTQPNLVSAEWTEDLSSSVTEKELGVQTVTSKTDTYKCICKCRREPPRQMLLCAVPVTEGVYPGIGHCERSEFQIAADRDTDCTTLDGDNCRGYSFYFEQDGTDALNGKVACQKKPVLSAGSESSVGTGRVDVDSDLY